MKLKLIAITALTLTQTIAFAQWSGTNPETQNGDAHITGKVGIGNTSPSTKLHITGSGQAIRLEAVPNSGSPASESTDITFTNPATSGSGRDWVIRSTGPNHPTASQTLEFWSPEFTSPKVWFPGDIKVGIGAQAVNSKLHIRGSGQAIRLDAVPNSGSPASESTDITFTNPATPGSGRDWVIRSTGPNHPTLSETLEFWAPEYSNPKVYYPGNIKVGIGTTDMPGEYQLYVADGILTEKVKVALTSSGDWADYVFAEDYQLKSLDEVESFIKDNHHLPEMPSAEEVVASGIDVAKMDAKLLEKIEELTLYTIQQEEKIEELQKQMSLLIEKSNQ